MSAPPVLLFLGAGKGLGTKIPAVFAEAGYKVAVVARTPKEEFARREYYQVQADFNNPESLPEVFAKVQADVGVPTVVVYNGTHLHDYSCLHTYYVPRLCRPRIALWVS